jgi:dihydroxy-acid dehydratase
MINRFDKSRLPSRYVSVGPERAPQRSYYYAMGMTEEEIARPFVAVASAGNDSAPCNTTLDCQADICREGVIEAAARRGGSTPSPSPTASPWATRACARAWSAAR